MGIELVLGKWTREWNLAGPNLMQKLSPTDVDRRTVVWRGHVLSL